MAKFQAGQTKPLTSGRKRGVPNRKTRLLKVSLEELGHDLPIKILELLPELPVEKRIDVYLELMQYVFPTDEHVRLFGQIKSNFGPIEWGTKITISEEGFAFEPSTKTLEQMLIELAAESRDNKIKPIVDEIKSCALDLVANRPMFSDDFATQMKQAGFREGKIQQVVKHELSEQVGRRCIKFVNQNAGKGVWLTGMVNHLDQIERLKFESKEELTSHVQAHTFDIQDFKIREEES